MSRKRILYIGGFELPDKNAAAQRVTANSKAFRDLGYDLFLIGLSKDMESINKIQEYEGFKYTNFLYPKSLGDWYKYLTSVKQFNPFLKENPDIIIAYNYPAVALEKLRRWTSKKGISLIADCTEWYEAKGDFVFRLVKSFDTFYRMEKVHPKLDGIIAISNYLYNYYSERMKNVVIVPPLVDISMDKWNIIGDNAEKDYIQIAFAGSLGKGNKDRLDKIINAFSKLKTDSNKLKFKLNVIGVSRIQYEQTFSTTLPNNLIDNVIFKGRISHLDTLRELKKADYSLILRDNNLANKAGFPTKFVEAISIGTPVLTNSTSNIDDFFQNRVNGFLLEVDSESLLIKGLKESISQPANKINSMKDYCLSFNPFKYQNYISSFEKLIQRL